MPVMSSVYIALDVTFNSILFFQVFPFDIHVCLVIRFFKDPWTWNISVLYLVESHIRV